MSKVIVNYKADLSYKDYSTSTQQVDTVILDYDGQVRPLTLNKWKSEIEQEIRTDDDENRISYVVVTITSFYKLDN